MMQVAFANYRLLWFLRKIPLVRNRIIPKIYALNQIEDEKYYIDCLSGVKLSNAVHRTTKPNRFKDLDEILLKHIGLREKHVIHDVAVSNGVSSIDLFKLLTKHNVEFRMYISDKFSKGYYAGRFLQTIYESDMQPRIFYICGIPLTNDSSTAIERMLFNYLIRLEKAKHDRNVKEFSFYNKDILNLLRTGTMTELEYDVLETVVKEKFTFVRVMNILNKIYFSDEEISKAILRIKMSMRDGAILQVGRTHPDSVNRVSFYQKSSGGLRLIADHNGGTEIRNLVHDTN